MSEEFYRRQKEMQQEHERISIHNTSHSTLETYQLEQTEAQSGHLPDPKGVDATPPSPTLFERLLKMLGLRK